MIQKWMGAAYVFTACSGVGFLFSAAHRQEERTLRQLEQSLAAMENELSYRQTPLPQLLRRAAVGEIGKVYRDAALELEKQIYSDAGLCMERALLKHPQIPPKTAELLKLLGMSLGKFDLAGQLRELAALKMECSRVLSLHCEDQIKRLRSYHTLGICAGLMLAILLL